MAGSLNHQLFMTKPTSKTVMEPSPLFGEGLLRKKEIARALSVSPRTIDTWIAGRKIPFIRINSRLNLFRRRDVERALSKLTVLEGSAK